MSNITPDHSDLTIAAIATPPGTGSIGIIRLSGNQAFDILKTFFKGKYAQPAFVSHKMYYGFIINPKNKEPIDEVLAVYMQAPHTYTREDIVEIHCHGSYLVLQDILQQLLTVKDVRLAMPGEFTKRAFLNGRIDLTQAEAVIDLLQAKTSEGLGMAVAMLQGSLHDRIMAVRNHLLTLLARFEVAIDFPEDEQDILNQQELLATLNNQVQQPLEELIALADRGKIFRDGLSVVILGRPNVGKSSLLNSLLQEDRAIVTAVAGTTRDTIEEQLNIKGIPIQIVDTAGIRKINKTAGQREQQTVEEIGITRTQQKISAADLILFLLDGSQPVSTEDYSLYNSVIKRPMIVVINKTDIAEQSAIAQCRQSFPEVPLVAVSAKNHEGLDILETTIFDLVQGGTSHRDPGHNAAPNLRQRAALLNSMDAVRKVTAGLQEDLPPDLMAINLQSALDYLGDIVGETTTEDVLDMIFEQFCIGK